jgi:hypothetical protein
MCGGASQYSSNSRPSQYAQQGYQPFSGGSGGAPQAIGSPPGAFFGFNQQQPSYGQQPRQRPTAQNPNPNPMGGSFMPPSYGQQGPNPMSGTPTVAPQTPGFEQFRDSGVHPYFPPYNPQEQFQSSGYHPYTVPKPMAYYPDALNMFNQG